MMQKPLDDLREEDIKTLIGTAETFRIEFKRELKLDSNPDRLEAAKDISAFANSAGGRIFYGIDEAKDGIARKLTPLSDFNLQSRLEDVVADRVHPFIHWRVRRVEIENGFILVAEVYPSGGRDLHMVNGGCFYRRGESRTVKMTEPEIREAYTRLAVGSLTLRQALSTEVKQQEELVPGRCQTVYIVPCFPKLGLMNPRALADTGKLLVEGPLKDYRTREAPIWEALRNIRPYFNGLHAHAEHSSFDLFFTRSGLVHLADDWARSRSSNPTWTFLSCLKVLQNILSALRVGAFVLDRCHYWGPVHVIQKISVPPCTTLVLEPHSGNGVAWQEGGNHQQVVTEVNLAEQSGNFASIARELCDQLFQAAGEVACPYFSEGGSIESEVLEAMRSPSRL